MRTYATPGELRELIRQTMGKDAAERYAGASFGNPGNLDYGGRLRKSGVPIHPSHNRK